MIVGRLLCLALVALEAPRLARADRIAGLSAKEFSRDVLDENWTLGQGASTGLMDGGIPVAQLKAAGPTPGDVATMWSKGTYDLRELSSILTLAVEGEGGGSRFSWIFANDPADGSTRGATHGMHAIDLGKPEHWIGFALEFNLVQGSEHDPAHRDVRIVLGGSASAEQQDTTNSCKVNFSFEKVMAKLMVYQRTLFVFTSEHADLNWQECAVVPLDNLAPEALSAGRVGFQSDGLAGWDQGRAQTVSPVCRLRRRCPGARSIAAGRAMQRCFHRSTAPIAGTAEPAARHRHRHHRHHRHHHHQQHQPKTGPGFLQVRASLDQGASCRWRTSLGTLDLAKSPG